jgi:hypothetical protein
MPGQLVRTIAKGLPTNVLVYATNSSEGQSVALINMDVSTAATVSIHGLPAANQIVIGGGDPMSTNWIASRSVWPGGAVTVPAMSMVILSNKQPGATPTPNFGTMR